MAPLHETDRWSAEDWCDGAGRKQESHKGEGKKKRFRIFGKSGGGTAEGSTHAEWMKDQLDWLYHVVLMPCFLQLLLPRVLIGLSISISCLVFSNGLELWRWDPRADEAFVRPIDKTHTNPVVGSMKARYVV